MPPAGGEILDTRIPRRENSRTKQERQDSHVSGTRSLCTALDRSHLRNNQ